MAQLSRFKMSQERLDALKDELYYLETVREKEVAEQIKEARSFGDLSEIISTMTRRKTPSPSAASSGCATLRMTMRRPTR